MSGSPTGALEGMVAVVTGGGRGIGEATARELAVRGAAVAVNDIDAGAADGVARAICEEGGTAASFPADVCDPDAVDDMMSEIARWGGGINALVSNAGRGGTGKSLVEISLHEWDQMIESNLRSTFICCRAVIPHLNQQGGGQIVCMSSVSALIGVAGSTHYCAAKGGIISFGKSLARELAPFHIRVNVVAPGLVDTDMSRARGIEHQRHLVEWHRIGLPEDVAHTVVFLVSPGSEFVTGQVISPNGGAYM